MSSDFQEQKVECIGGLEVTKNNLLMSTIAPGSASILINYEVSPFGGYSRLLGYEKFNSSYPEVGVGTCEGAVLGIVIYEDSGGDEHYYAARKNTSGNTYSIWKYNGGSAWTSITLPATRSTSTGGRNISRLRWKQFNDGSTNWLIIVDGVNPPLTYDGTTWREMTSSGTGTTSSQGGDQIIDYPNYISIFKRHLFLARSDNGGRAILCHSAPNAPFNFTAADGAGQILPSFDIENIHPFRDSLYIFGNDRIGATELTGSTFIYKDVTSGVGLIAPDTVVELGSSLVFLSQDGFRPIAGTDRIGDVEINPITDQVRPLLEEIVSTYSKESINSILISRKNQLRVSYGGSASGTENTLYGYILNTRIGRQTELQFESSQTYGLTFWCGTSKIVDGSELTLHGGLDGVVYKQEVGNTFDGEAIFSSFSPPYLDQNTVINRKKYKEIYYFIRIDNSVSSSSDQNFYLSEKLDWDDSDVNLPSDFIVTTDEGNVFYNDGILYNTGAKYGGNTSSVIKFDLEGTGFSIKPGFVTTGITPKITIFGFVIKYTTKGVK